MSKEGSLATENRTLTEQLVDEYAMQGTEVLVDDQNHILDSDFSVYWVVEELVGNCADERSRHPQNKIQVKIKVGQTDKEIQVKVEDNIEYPNTEAAELTRGLNKKKTPIGEKGRPGGLGVDISKKIATAAKGKLVYTQEGNRIIANFACKRQ